MAPPPPRRPIPPAPIATGFSTESFVRDEEQPRFYNADALKSLNGNVSMHFAPQARHDPARRRAGAFQKFSPRTPRSPRSPHTPGTPRRRCSTLTSGSPQVYKTVGEASVERALGSMVHSLRLAASSPNREISRWSSSTEGSEEGSGSFASLFWRAGHRITKSDSSNSASASRPSMEMNACPSTSGPSVSYEYRQQTDAVSIKSSKSARSLRSIRSFASFHSAKSTTSTKSTRAFPSWHRVKTEEDPMPPIPSRSSASVTTADTSSEPDDHIHHFGLHGHHHFGEKPRKIVGGILKRLTPKRRPKQAQGLHSQDRSPFPAEHAVLPLVENEHVRCPSTRESSLGHSSAPFNDNEFLRTSAKALAVLGLIDNHHGRSRPQSIASETLSDNSHASEDGRRRGRWSPTRGHKTTRSSSRPTQATGRRNSVDLSKALPPRPHSAHGHATPTRSSRLEAQPQAHLPVRRSSRAVSPAVKLDSVASGSIRSSVFSPAPSFYDLWASESSPATSTEELWGTPLPPPRRRTPQARGFSSLSSSQSSLDVAHRFTSRRSESVLRTEAVASHLAAVAVETDDEAPILTPRSKAVSLESFDEPVVVALKTPRRSRQPVSGVYEMSPRALHGIHGTMAALSLEEHGHTSQRKVRAAALVAASDPLMPRRLICQMRSRSRSPAVHVSEIDFTRSPRTREIPVPLAPYSYLCNESTTSLPYGRKHGHTASASVHTFGAGSMGLMRSNSISTVASAASVESMASAGMGQQVRGSDTVESLFGRYGDDESAAWDHNGAGYYKNQDEDYDHPADPHMLAPRSQQASWSRANLTYETRRSAEGSSGVVVW